MAIKLIILCGLFAIALGFTIPEDNFVDPNNYYEAFGGQQQPAVEDGEVLVRNARSPQGRLEARGEHSSRYGESANLKYTHPISKNLDAYVQGGRNFRYNENTGHAGLSYRF